jgi:hypothetical protein
MPDDVCDVKKECSSFVGKSFTLTRDRKRLTGKASNQ